MQTFTPTPARHGATGVLVNNDNLLTLHDVIHVFLEQVMGTQSGVHVMQKAEVNGGIQVFTRFKQLPLQQQLLHFFVAALGQLYLTGFFVNSKIAGSGKWWTPGSGFLRESLRLLWLQSPDADLHSNAGPAWCDRCARQQ